MAPKAPRSAAPVPQRRPRATQSGAHSWCSINTKWRDDVRFPCHPGKVDMVISQTLAQVKCLGKPPSQRVELGPCRKPVWLPRAGPQCTGMQGAHCTSAPGRGDEGGCPGPILCPHIMHPGAAFAQGTLWGPAQRC